MNADEKFELYHEAISQIIWRLGEEIKGLNGRLNGLGAVAMEKIDMRRPQELELRFFISNWVRAEQKTWDETLIQITQLLTEAKETLEVLDFYGDDAI